MPGQLPSDDSQPGCATVIVALNLGNQPAAAVLPESIPPARITVSAFADRNGEIIKGEIDLRPSEGLLIETAK